MTLPTFIWDPRKNRFNQAKHGVSFEEAKTVFLDENARLIADTTHSDIEERFLLLGLSLQLRLLVVCHCFRAEEDIIRIISARKATLSEQSEYARYLP